MNPNFNLMDMVERTYRVMRIGNREELLIDFKDEHLQLLSTFLESDVQAFERMIKTAFDKVISGASEYEEVNGNVCCAEISTNTTKIYDNLAENAMGNWCELDTKELCYIIEEWCDRVRKFKLEHHN